MKLVALGLCLSFTFFVSQSSLGSDITLPSGTAVSVKLADTIDSARDSFGKQYAASVAAPIVVAGSQAVPAGSRATVVLIHNNSGWITQLTGLTVNGRQLQVSSSAGILPAKTAPTVSTFQRIGLSPAPTTAAAQRILLPPATELRFFLIGSTTPARAVKTPSHSRPAARTERSFAASSDLSEQEPGIPYLCRARDNSDRVLPVSYYVADVFETSDNPAAVEKRWYQFLVATYPYRFANNHHAIVQCIRLPDLAAERDARKQLEGESRSENAQIVDTRWHYRLGPPPSPNASSAPSTVPAAAAR